MKKNMKILVETKLYWVDAIIDVANRLSKYLKKISKRLFRIVTNTQGKKLILGNAD